MSAMSASIERAMCSFRKHFDLFGARGVLRRAMINLPGMSAEFRSSIPMSSRKVMLRLGTTDVAAFEHVFVDNEYGFSLAHEPSIIIDAGANVGMSAVYFSERFHAAKIIAIEPELDNFNVLKRNSELFPRIIPVHAALWNRDGVVSIMRQEESGSWGTRVNAVKDPSRAQVRSLKLSTLLEEYNIKQVDLLKIDVEGAECEILEDAPVWVERVRVICAELHDRFRPGCSKAFEIATAGFPTRWRRGELSCVAREDAISFP
jgi:FkbM family methyltransferase